MSELKERYTIDRKTWVFIKDMEKERDALRKRVAELEAQLAKWGSHAVEFACQSNDEINEARGGTDE